MNERQAAGLFAGISVIFIAAEAALGFLSGFDQKLTLFCLSIYVGLAGLLFSLRPFMGERSGIESVSTRRARAMRQEGMSGMLEGYEVDDEFLDDGRRRRGPSAKNSGNPASPAPAPERGELLRDAVRSHAAMVGGLEKLQAALVSLDEAAFGKMARSAGFSDVTKEELALLVAAMISEERPGEPALSISLDRADFDDYIRRSMTGGESGSADEGAGFSIGLDGDYAGKVSEPPLDFSHDPKAVFSKLRKAGEGR
jgi:hypothetical protein